MRFIWQVIFRLVLFYFIFDIIAYYDTATHVTNKTMREKKRYQTRATNLFLCNPQQRNTAGRIFGGFLMRRAFELAHATAYRFCGQPPKIVEVDEVNFKAPVSIGDLLKIEAHVLYTEVKDGCRQMHVEAIAHITDPEAMKDTVSNEFQFTFEINGEEPPLRRMLPASGAVARRMAERMLAENGKWK